MEKTTNLNFTHICTTNCKTNTIIFFKKIRKFLFYELVGEGSRKCVHKGRKLIFARNNFSCGPELYRGSVRRPENVKNMNIPSNNGPIVLSEGLLDAY